MCLAGLGSHVRRRHLLIGTSGGGSVAERLLPSGNTPFRHSELLFQIDKMGIGGVEKETQDLICLLIRVFELEFSRWKQVCRGLKGEDCRRIGLIEGSKTGERWWTLVLDLWMVFKYPIKLFYIFFSYLKLQYLFRAIGIRRDVLTAFLTMWTSHNAVLMSWILPPPSRFALVLVEVLTRWNKHKMNRLNIRPLSNGQIVIKKLLFIFYYKYNILIYYFTLISLYIL